MGNEIKTRNKKFVLIGAIISLLLLLVFLIIQIYDTKLLALPAEWILVAIFPTVISLFIGGYITKFEGFGIKIEADLHASISTSVELKAIDALAEISYEDKGDTKYLEQMPREKAESIKRLIFESGKYKFYSIKGIREYMKKMVNLEFFEVRTKKGQFICFIPISYFKPDANMQIDNIFFYYDKLERFVNAIGEGTVLDEFADIAVSCVVKSNDSLIEVLKTLRDENINLAAVISKRGKYIGVLYRKDIEKRVIEILLSNEPDER